MSPKTHDQLEWDSLPGLFPGFTDPGRWLPLLRRHQDLLDAAASHTRVTSVPPFEAVRRHYAESLELLRVVFEAIGPPQSVVDVGSGGGYPGLVIAAVLAPTPVTLVEPLKKRARLLEAIAADLGLANVQVEPLRAEDAGRGPLRDSAGLVTARAVAPLPELLEYTAPLASVGGLIVLPKGSGVADELDAAQGAIAELRCELSGVVPARPEVAESLAFVLLRKGEATPAAYPRRAGIPGKRPLQNR
jgi:16S rRNA (guanine527-N7)-methyltransferase